MEDFVLILKMDSTVGFDNCEKARLDNIDYLKTKNHGPLIVDTNLYLPTDKGRRFYVVYEEPTPWGDGVAHCNVNIEKTAVNIKKEGTIKERAQDAYRQIWEKFRDLNVEKLPDGYRRNYNIMGIIPVPPEKPKIELQYKARSPEDQKKIISKKDVKILPVAAFSVLSNIRKGKEIIDNINRFYDPSKFESNNKKNIVLVAIILILIVLVYAYGPSIFGSFNIV